MATSKPTVIIVPGAWHDASTFQRVTKLLEQENYKVVPVDLASCNPPKHLTDMGADTAKIRAEIEKAVDKGRVCQLYFTAIKTCKILQILFINLSHVFHTDNDVALTATFRRKNLV